MIEIVQKEQMLRHGEDEREKGKKNRNAHFKKKLNQYLCIKKKKDRKDRKVTRT